MDHASDISVRAHCYHLACEANRAYGAGPTDIMETAKAIYAWITEITPAQPLKVVA